MKVFWLRLLGSDFTEDNGEWVSSVVDLYDNDLYVNYSTTKSNYGTNLLGNDTWTGLDSEGTTPASSESGYEKNGRWVDTTGRLDIVSFSVEGAEGAELAVYSSDLSDDTAFRDEWGSFDSVPANEAIDAVSVDQNVKFVVSEIDSLADDAEFLIRVEIGKPVMAPFYRMTRQVLNRFPEWMAMRELDNQPDGELAVPESLGGQVINAIAGEWLDDIRSQMKQSEFQRFIDTVDLDHPAWAFETEIDSDPLWLIEGDGTELTRAADWAEFLESDDNADVCFIDYEEGRLYSRQEYTELSLNGEPAPQSAFHIWNFVDELGMLVDIERHHLETNDTFRWRILDVYKHHGGGSYEGFRNAVRRELNLWQSIGVQPDSETGFPDSEDALPEVLDMQDIENDRDPDIGGDDDRYFFDAQGLPTRKFTSLVRNLSWRYPATWGRFKWDQGIWDVAEDDFRGFSTTPNMLDGEQVDPEFLQYGVGGLDDLKIVSPTEYIGAREFSAKLIARGFAKELVNKYLPVQVDMEIYGEGLREEFDNPTKTVWLSLEVETGSGTYVHSFQMSSQSDVDSQTTEPTAASFDNFDPFDDINLSTRSDIDFVDKNTEEPYNGDGIIPVGDINSFTLLQGRLSAGSYGFIENSDEFEAWFTTDDTDVLTFDSANVTATVTSDVQPAVVFKSKAVNSLGDQPWRTDSFEAEVLVNDTPDHSAHEAAELELPEFVWGEGVTGRDIKVQLRISRLADPQDPSSNVVFGGLAEEEEGLSSFIDSSQIEINSSTSWSTDGILTLPDSTTDLTIGVLDGADYPKEVSHWVPSKWESTPEWDGTIDKVGPWRNGQPQREVGAHSRWVVVDQLTRDDFGIPHDEDHVVTRMQATVTDQSVGEGVVVWLDSQIVESDADFRELVDYPDNAISEYDDGGTFRYDPFVIHARLIQVPNEDWNPYIHSGYFFDGDQEYYLFADKQIETFAAEPFILTGLAHQGAPVIVRASAGTFTKDDGYLREVAFPDENFDLTLLNEEILAGTGTVNLFLAYDDVYNIAVEDAETGDAVVVQSTSASDNVVELQSESDTDKEYRVSYNVYGSYVVDRSYWDDSAGEYKTRIQVDSQAAAEITEYEATYEGAGQNAFTEADVALNPMKTIMNEGYIFIGRHEYNIESLMVEASPSKLVANGEDYILLSIQCLDVNGNPKPDQQIDLSSTFGTFDSGSVTVDRDGFVMASLVAETGTDSLYGEVTVTAGALSEVIAFDIEPDMSTAPRIYAAPTTHYIEADGQHEVKVYGITLLSEHEPASGIEVNWKRARHLRSLFGGTVADEGTVTSDSDGRFEIGPLTVSGPDDPGYWFVAIEATIDSELVGDVVFWFEYSEPTFGVEAATGIPTRGSEFRNPPGTIHPFANEAKFPYDYDEQDPVRDPQDIVVRWLPPSWFPLPKYRQYQLGLLSDSNDELSYSEYASNLRPYISDL